MAKMGYRTVTVYRRLRPFRLAFLDADSPWDLIDYWNLRAAGGYIRAVPRQWADALAEKGAAFITQHLVPYARIQGMMQRATLLHARSVPMGEVEAYAEQLRAQAPNSLIIQSSAPRMWEEISRESEPLAEEGNMEVNEWLGENTLL